MGIKASVIIPNYNGKAYLKNCIDSLLKQTETNFEIIIVDDFSTDGSFKEIKEYAETLCLEKNVMPTIKFKRHNNNHGFCKSVNDGILMANSDYVILLNNDTIVDADFVAVLLKSIKKSNNIFSVSSKMISMHNKDVIDDAGDLYCILGWAFSPAKDKSVNLYNRREKIFAACGGASIYRKKVFEEIGLFDENHFAYLEDIDIGYRAKLAGYINVYEPNALVYHLGSATSGSRHNAFKVFLSARNSIYLIYKNMPGLQILINSPFLLCGILIKIVYFIPKKLVKNYLEGIASGVATCIKSKSKIFRVSFKEVPFSRFVEIEVEMLKNTFRRVIG